MATGDVIKLGTLYVGGSKQINPKYPWQNGYTPNGAPKGDIPVYSTGNIEIRDTDNSNDYYKIKWVEVNDHGKKLLIADRNLLVSVSWDELNKQGLIFGKKITIDGKEYLCRVLTGGITRRTDTDSYLGGSPKENEWDRFITNEDKIEGLPTPTSTDLDSTQNDADRLGAHNSKWNWYYCRSWCQETYYSDSFYRVLRGSESPRYFTYSNSSNTYSNCGWRPVLEPITSKPKYLGKVKLGTLYHNGSPQPVPTRPWQPFGDAFTSSDRGKGDIPIATDGLSNWNLGNTSKGNELTWVKIEDNGKTLFICDRVILSYAPWNKLNEQGYVYGKRITIDGAEYLCDLLTGGTTYRSGLKSDLGGFPVDNEWDRFICNEDKIEGLPTPTSTDLDDTLNSTDLDSAHNQFWNWCSMGTICKEPFLGKKDRCTYRGYRHARYFNDASSEGLDACYGWRPVLRLLSSPPEVTDTYRGEIQTTSNFSITYTPKSADGLDLTVIEYVDNNVKNTLSVKSGTQYTFNIPKQSVGGHTAKLVIKNTAGLTVEKLYKFTVLQEYVLELSEPVTVSDQTTLPLCNMQVLCGGEPCHIKATSDIPNGRLEYTSPIKENSVSLEIVGDTTISKVSYTVS